MTKFSANLGFLWTELALPDAIHAAHAAGFDAVECHFPYDVPAGDVVKALQDTNMQMLGINTRRGNPEAGDNGLCSIPDRVEEARAAIDEALAYGAEISALCVHVMAGTGYGEAAHATFVSNLRYACSKAGKLGLTILIEPLNTYDAPEYFLNGTDQARGIIEEVGADNLKLMFDCYHVQLLEGDISNKLEEFLPLIGHIQFAAVPGRGAPDHGELNYAHVFKRIAELGYRQPLGAEYKPDSATSDGLAWMCDLR